MDAWMRKKTMAGLLAMALAVSPFAGAVSQVSAATAVTASFTDVEKSYAKTEIAELVKLGILSGDGAGQFNPTAGSTRAEMAKVLTLALGLKPNPEAAVSFQDIPANAWYKGFVGAMVAAGITKGTSATSFSPNEQVSREALAVFYIRAMGLEESAQALQGEVAFADANKISTWALPAVRLAAKLGFIQGVEKDGKLYFEPAAKAERQALAKLTYSFYVNKEEYVEQAAKIVKEEGTPSASASPSATPAPSATPTPTPISGGGGGGYVPPVATPTPPSSATPTPTDSTNPTPAPTMGEGDPSVSKPYFVYPFYKNDFMISGLVDGVAKVRVYIDGKLIQDGQSQKDGTFFVFVGENKLASGGDVAITAQRAGESESAPLYVKPLGLVGESTAPVVDVVYAGDILITGKATPNSQIKVTTPDGDFVGSGSANYKTGEFYFSPMISFSGNEQLVFVSTEVGKESSTPTKVTVASASNPIKSNPVNVTDVVYEGPMLVKTSAPAPIAYKIQTQLAEGSKYTERFIEMYDTEHLYLSTMQTLVSGDCLTVQTQEPRKAPSDILQLTVRAAKGQTESPVVQSVNAEELSIKTKKEAFLFLKDQNNSIASYSYPNSEVRQFTLKYLKPGETVLIYAFIPGEKMSEGVPVQVPVPVPVVSSRTAVPQVSRDLFESDGKIEGVSEPDSRVTVYIESATTGKITAISSYASADGHYSIRLSDSLKAGDHLYITAQLAEKEGSPVVMMTVQSYK